VPALDRGRWVAAILDLVERAKTRPDEYTRMREEARRRATATYGWESVLRTLTTKVLVPQPGPLADEG
jgi:hypothetical protein